MIRLSLLAVGAFALSASVSFAQAPAEPSPLPPTPAEITKDNPPSRPLLPHGERNMGSAQPDMGPSHRPPPPERGPRIHIENGRTRVDLHCAEGETTKECADALLQVLDRLQNSSLSDDNSGRGTGRNRDRDYDRDRDRFEGR
jgi:hypothetical protein